LILLNLSKSFREGLPNVRQLKNGENIMICEIDVPAKNKKGEYGKDCDENNICYMSIAKLELLLQDTNEAFGHGLCLAYSLLVDLQNTS
jgi:hypothetical protein